MIKRYLLKPYRKLPLLERMMGSLAGADAFIAIEGDLADWKLSGVPPVASQPRGALKRHNEPSDDQFMVLPLQQEACVKIFREISRLGFSKRIMHVQIEKDGALAFGAYDNFHHECVFASSAISNSLLDALVADGLAHIYRIDN